MSICTSDLNTSRRVNFITCFYKNPQKNSKNQLIYGENYDGFFEAKIENSENLGKQVTAQSFLFNSTNITISTNDYIEDIKPNAEIYFLGFNWRADTITKNIVRSSYQLDNEFQIKYVLELRR